MLNKPWSINKAVELCKKIEAVCPKYGCHVALTGGTLYKDGFRKDCDILFYRIRQVDEIDLAGLINALAGIGLVKISGFGWCHKFTYEGMPVDGFMPEAPDGQYETEQHPTESKINPLPAILAEADIEF
jgi:hypothetical protein